MVPSWEPRCSGREQLGGVGGAVPSDGARGSGSTESLVSVPPGRKSCRLDYETLHLSNLVMLHKVIIIAKFCFDYTVMCLHMPAKNTHLTFIFVMVLIAVIGLFSFTMNLVLCCGVSVYLLVICVQRIGLCVWSVCCF